MLTNASLPYLVTTILWCEERNVLCHQWRTTNPQSHADHFLFLMTTNHLNLLIREGKSKSRGESLGFPLQSPSLKLSSSISLLSKKRVPIQQSWAGMQSSSQRQRQRGTYSLPSLSPDLLPWDRNRPSVVNCSSERWEQRMLPEFNGQTEITSALGCGGAERSWWLSWRQLKLMIQMELTFIVSDAPGTPHQLVLGVCTGWVRGARGRFWNQSLVSFSDFYLLEKNNKKKQRFFES